MKNVTFKVSLLSLAIILPTFSASAENSEENLQKQLTEIKIRLTQLEKLKNPVTEQNKTPINFYGSLRPTFGKTSSDSKDSWDVGDALSRIGIAAEHKLSNGMIGFIRGEFKVQIQGDAHFGDARKVYVGIKGNFGRLAIGKQSTTQYSFMADPVDIFNRAATPLAYDDASPFRQQEMVSYRMSFSQLEFRVEGQFMGESDHEGSDFFNTGVKFQGDSYTIAVAYLTKNLSGTDENTLGVSASKTLDDWYIAATYQDIDRGGNREDKSTLDIVGSYKINGSYKLKIGYSTYFDDLVAIKSNEVSRINTTLEWQGSPDYRLFFEFQNNNYANNSTRDNNQLTVGMRYNFDYTF